MPPGLSLIASARRFLRPPGGCRPPPDARLILLRPPTLPCAGSLSRRCRSFSLAPPPARRDAASPPAAAPLITLQGRLHAVCPAPVSQWQSPSAALSPPPPWPSFTALMNPPPCRSIAGFRCETAAS